MRCSDAYPRTGASEAGVPATAEQQIQMAAHGKKEKEERGARELPQRVPLTGDEDGAALSQRSRGR